MNTENIKIKDICTLGIDNFKKNNLIKLLKLSKFIIFLVGKERLELSQYCYHWILSPTRLPVPPFALPLLFFN